MKLLNVVTVVEVLKTKGFFTQSINKEGSFTIYYHTVRISLFLDKHRGKVELQGLFKCTK